VLEAQARGVPGALLERCRLLWARDKGHRAMLELQLALQQQLDGGGFSPGLAVLVGRERNALRDARIWRHGAVWFCKP
jgi:hypothetical protein